MRANLTLIFSKIRDEYPEFEWVYVDGTSFSLAHASKIGTTFGECHYGFRYFREDGNELMRKINKEIQEYIDGSD